jgi:hypothetical protein
VQAKDWAVVLSILLSRCVGPNPNSKCQETYEEMLQNLSETLDPVAFLALLPSNGCLTFYLRFIEKAIAHHSTAGIQRRLVTLVKKIEEERMATS